MASRGRTLTVDCYGDAAFNYSNDAEDGKHTHEAPDPAVRAKTWTVPLSLHTHTSRSSGRNATPYITALSAPLRSSLTSFPETVSHIRIRVPREEVVASSRPDGGTESVLRADVCAAMIDTGCFVGAGGGREGGVGDGGPIGCGGGQGGRCMSCMCPIWRPGMASSVECAAVASASKPWSIKKQISVERSTAK